MMELQNFAEVETGANPGLLSQETRIDLFHKALLQTADALMYLRQVGVAKTNFLECDERSIYVFDYLFKVPLTLKSSNPPVVARFATSHLLEKLIGFLQRRGSTAEADILIGYKETCNFFSMTQYERITEEKISAMAYYLRLVSGILREVMDRGLALFNTVETPALCLDFRYLSSLQDQVRLTHVSYETCLDRWSTALTLSGHKETGELISKFKGRPTLLDAL